LLAPAPGGQHAFRALGPCTGVDRSVADTPGGVRPDRRARPRHERLQRRRSGRGVWHICWNWRKTGAVATNHDRCYARSADQGRRWTCSDGKVCGRPIAKRHCED
ncbi:MAG: BNR repeat-containing protein, partial [Planctomycetes bacterium]|nr:BNR repeat-containing protein [Planctomycetota bacterium]